MTPSEEQPDQPTRDSELSFSALEEQDVLVQAFRHFLQIELSKPRPKQISDVVAEFSRRVTFLTKIFDLDHLTDDLASQIPGLSDAKMAELALDASDSAKGRERLARYLEAQPYPHYESDPSNRDLVIRVEENGTRVSGHFVNKNFVVVNDEQ
ncbi:MAG: hypothetical protein J0M26_21500 [Planctomycetes bacterium]|jgi:hypothetical protein|nr:hypothetical protein [Planctomycetota bacterium]